tara:strand:+ start:7037 stop:7783 length:747 start_codon:yes stop_codon:yes gene_type:complete
MTEKCNIAILGDSWAHGEWGWIGDKNYVTHTGTQHFLQREFTKGKIVNYALAGGSNLYQIDFIREHVGLDNFRETFDYVVVFWTDPGRDVLNNITTTQGGNFSNLTKSHYQALCDTVTIRSLRQLQNLGLPVILIGGHVSLPDEKFREDHYKNLTYLIDRVANLIDKPFWDREKQVAIAGTLDNKIDWLQVDRTGVMTDKFLAEIKEDVKKLIEPLDPACFPDSGHGGRIMHRIVSNAIVKEILNDNE